jgi:hypothetical protein
LIRLRWEPLRLGATTARRRTHTHAHAGTPTHGHTRPRRRTYGHAPAQSRGFLPSPPSPFSLLLPSSLPSFPLSPSPSLLCSSPIYSSPFSFFSLPFLILCLVPSPFPLLPLPSPRALATAHGNPGNSFHGVSSSLRMTRHVVSVESPAVPFRRQR